MSSLAVSPSHGAGSARWLSLARPSLAQLVWRVRLRDSRSLLPSLLPGGRDLLQLAWRRSTQPRGVCWLGRDAPERAIAAATGDRKPVVQHVLSTGFRAGSLRGCWGRQGAFPSPGRRWWQCQGFRGQGAGGVPCFLTHHCHHTKPAGASTLRLSQLCCHWALDEERMGGFRQSASHMHQIYQID